jgi:uncharacterized protein (DUF2141 family)
VRPLAFAVCHEENNHRGFNRDALRRPSEDYGFANGALATPGLPDFGAVRLTVPFGGTRMSIRLRS